MEERREDIESARKISEMGGRSRQRNARVHSSEGRVQEEVESEAEKRAEKFEDKMDGREECRILMKCWREKKRTWRRRKERNTTRGMVKTWKD
jgi:hypothetical protein